MFEIGMIQIPQDIQNFQISEERRKIYQQLSQKLYVFSSLNNIQTQNKVFFSLIFRNEIHAVQSKMSFNLRACVQQKQNYC